MFKCSFLFDFLSEVLKHDCVVHENGKTDESQKFNAKRVISSFNIYCLHENWQALIGCKKSHSSMKKNILAVYVKSMS